MVGSSAEDEAVDPLFEPVAEIAGPVEAAVWAVSCACKIAFADRSSRIVADRQKVFVAEEVPDVKGILIRCRRTKGSRVKVCKRQTLQRAQLAKIAKIRSSLPVSSANSASSAV